MAKQGLNGDTKVIVERIENFKEMVKEEFKETKNENREDHQNIFKILSKHGNSISYLKAYAYGVGCAIAVISMVLIKMNIG